MSELTRVDLRNHFKAFAELWERAEYEEEPFEEQCERADNAEADANRLRAEVESLKEQHRAKVKELKKELAQHNAWADLLRKECERLGFNVATGATLFSVCIAILHEAHKLREATDNA